MASGSMRFDNTVYILTLSQKEAQALHDVLMCVGGHPETTRRGIVDEVRAALGSMEGILGHLPDPADITGSVVFR